MHGVPVDSPFSKRGQQTCGNHPEANGDEPAGDGCSFSESVRQVPYEQLRQGDANKDECRSLRINTRFHMILLTLEEDWTRLAAKVRLPACKHNTLTVPYPDTHLRKSIRLMLEKLCD